MRKERINGDQQPPAADVGDVKFDSLHDLEMQKKYYQLSLTNHEHLVLLEVLASEMNYEDLMGCKYSLVLVDERSEGLVVARVHYGVMPSGGNDGLAYQNGWIHFFQVNRRQWQTFIDQRDERREIDFNAPALNETEMGPFRRTVTREEPHELISDEIIEKFERALSVDQQARTRFTGRPAYSFRERERVFNALSVRAHETDSSLRIIEEAIHRYPDNAPLLAVIQRNIGLTDA